LGSSADTKWLEPRQTELKLEFHWLHREKRDQTGPVSLLEEPEYNKSECSGKMGPVLIRDKEKKCPLVYSGHVITMTTIDPEGVPLPDTGTLEMQFLLQRIFAMSGPAEWQDREDHDDDDDETGVAAHDTVEDEGIIDHPTDSPRGRRRYRAHHLASQATIEVVRLYKPHL
jgi:hypothetical protein